MYWVIWLKGENKQKWLYETDKLWIILICYLSESMLSDKNMKYLILIVWYQIKDIQYTEIYISCEL